MHPHDFGDDVFAGDAAEHEYVLPFVFRHGLAQSAPRRKGQVEPVSGGGPFGTLSPGRLVGLVGFYLARIHRPSTIIQ